MVRALFSASCHMEMLLRLLTGLCTAEIRLQCEQEAEGPQDFSDHRSPQAKTGGPRDQTRH